MKRIVEDMENAFLIPPQFILFHWNVSARNLFQARIVKFVQTMGSNVNVPQVVLGMVPAKSMEVVRVIVIIMVVNVKCLIRHVLMKAIVKMVDAVLK